MRRNNLFGNVKSQAHPAVRRELISLEPHHRLEDEFSRAAWNWIPVIVDGHNYASVIASHLNGHNATRSAVLQRIAKQIRHDLREAVAIPFATEIATRFKYDFRIWV